MRHALVTQACTRTHGPRGKSGLTIAEAIVAVAVSALCLGGVMLLNAEQLKLVKSTRQSNAASFALQDRIEQLRLTAWDNLVDPNWLKTKVFNTSPTCSAFLGNYKERLRLSAWPTDTSIQNLEITASSQDGFTVVSDNTGMQYQKQGRVDLIVTWTGTDGRIRERSSATLISNSGITRVGLVGYGAYSGSSNPTPGSSTPDPLATPSPTTPTPVPATPSSGGGKGNGNVGGKGGKG